MARLAAEHGLEVDPDLGALVRLGARVDHVVDARPPRGLGDRLVVALPPLVDVVAVRPPLAGIHLEDAHPQLVVVADRQRHGLLTRQRVDRDE